MLPNRRNNINVLCERKLVLENFRRQGEKVEYGKVNLRYQGRNSQNLLSKILKV